jgi:hypothetical protein
VINNEPVKVKVPGDNDPTPRIKINKNQQVAQERTK